MSRDINDANFFVFLGRRSGQGKPGESQVYRHFSLALFLQPVGMSSSKRLYQGRFPMVDMTGGSNDAHLQPVRRSLLQACAQPRERPNVRS
jgi:hypothetical protein